MVIYAVGFPLLMLAAVIDSSVMVHFRYYNGQPSLVLILIIAWGLLNDLGEALTWAVIGGIFVDLLSITPTGTSSLGYVLAVLMVSTIFGRIGRRNILIPPFAALVATMIYQSVWLIVVIVLIGSIPIGQAIVTWILPSMIFNAVGVIVIFRIMGGIIEFFRPPKAVL